jgi:hypothetical protein
VQAQEAIKGVRARHTHLRKPDVALVGSVGSPVVVVPLSATLSLFRSMYDGFIPSMDARPRVHDDCVLALTKV